MGHALMENRSGLIVAATLTKATGIAERQATEAMIVRRSPGARRITLGADKAYDAAAFVADMRALNVTPHIAQNTSGRLSAVDARTTRHSGYAVSQQKRKRIEEPFDWAKTIGGLARPMLRGVKKLGFRFILTMAGYNLGPPAKAHRGQQHDPPIKHPALRKAINDKGHSLSSRLRSSDTVPKSANFSSLLVLLHHKILCRECLAICAEQQGHRGRVLDEGGNQAAAHGCD